MKILTVGFRRLETTGNYNNIAMEATAEIEPGESPEQALDGVRKFVNERVDQILENERYARQVESNIGQREYELQRIEQQVREAQQRYEQAREFLSKHNVPLPEMPNYYRPSGDDEYDDSDPFENL